MRKQPTFHKAMRLARLEKAVRANAPITQSRGDVYAQLWKDPKYVRLTERKDQLLRLWNLEDSGKHLPGGSPQKAARLDRLVKAALKRMYKYEDAALRKAGFS